MTKDEALKMCLEYIETDAHERKYVRHAIKKALAQPEPPPECKTEAEKTAYAFGWFKSMEAQRTWAGLTDREIDELWMSHHDGFGNPLSATGYEKAIEAKLKEKNT